MSPVMISFYRQLFQQAIINFLDKYKDRKNITDAWSRRETASSKINLYTHIKS